MKALLVVSSLFSTISAQIQNDFTSLKIKDESCEIDQEC